MKKSLRSLLKGMGSILNICPPRRKSKINLPREYEWRGKTDAEAIEGDWEKVGEDLTKAAGNYRK